MTQFNRTIFLPTIQSFQSSIPLTSTPKLSRKSSPLSSTLKNSSYEKMDLSISAIKPSRKFRYYLPRHSSKRIQLKYLLYAKHIMKTRLIKSSHHQQLKIYLI